MGPLRIKKPRIEHVDSQGVSFGPFCIMIRFELLHLDGDGPDCSSPGGTWTHPAWIAVCPPELWADTGSLSRSSRRQKGIWWESRGTGPMEWQENTGASKDSNAHREWCRETEECGSINVLSNSIASRTIRAHTQDPPMVFYEVVSQGRICGWG